MLNVGHGQAVEVVDVGLVPLVRAALLVEVDGDQHQEAVRREESKHLWREWCGVEWCGVGASRWGQGEDRGQGLKNRLSGKVAPRIGRPRVRDTGE